MKVFLHNPSLQDGVQDGLIDRFPCVIGRARGVERRLSHFLISRYHCRLSWQGEELILEDLDSRNGTYVNGKRIRLPTALCHGDEVYVGPLAFRVHILDVAWPGDGGGSAGGAPAPPRGKEKGEST
jgi:pSer/pThr/pTyr-binding forkhead associated (FHA) protein